MVSGINGQTPIATITTLSRPSERDDVPGAKLLDTPQDKVEVQQELDKVKKSHKDLKAFFAANTVMENLVRGFAGLGGVWGTLTCILGGAPGGMIGVWAGASSAFNVADGVSLAKYSAFNRYKPGAIMGTLQTAQGVTLMAAAMGLPGVSRYAAIASLACFLGRMGYSVYNSIAESKPDDGAAARNQKKLEEKDVLVKLANKVADAVKGDGGVPKTLPSES
jgi:hypothetical protein